MPWSGSTFTRSNGVFTGSGVWTSDRDAGVKIRSDRHDSHDQDLADGINATLKKDGGNTPTADLPMGGFKHSNVDNATARNQYAATGQVQDSGFNYATDTGAADAYVITPSPAITAYTAGQKFSFIASATNTGASTLNVSGLGVKSITKEGATALVAGEIKVNALVEVQYDGTQFQLVSRAVDPVINDRDETITGDKTFSGLTTFSNRVTVDHAIDGGARQDIASASTVNLDTATSNYVRITGTTTITAITLSDGHWRDVVFSGALTLTNGASLILPDGQNRVTVAGDTMRVFGESGGVVRVVNYSTAGGRLSTVDTFTSGGTWNKPANLDYVIVEVVGGGGAGSGSSSTGGGGGGGGGTAIKKIAAASLGSTETVTVGAGAPAPGAGGNGTAGGNSSFGAHCSATGGAGGTAVGGPGAGGVGSSGDQNIGGGDGAPGIDATTDTGGNGGSSTKGGGGAGQRGAADGSPGNNYGGGGGGSGLAGGTPRFGSAGADGIVIVHNYVK